MPDADPPLTVRLTDPGDVAAALPHLLGFRPEESLVVVSLRGATGLRLGLTARVDLPAPEHRELVLRGLVRSLATDRPDAVLLLVVSEDEDDSAVPPERPWAGRLPELPHRPLVHEAVLAFDGAGIAVREALLVRRGRWWSYDCTGGCCLPHAGTPLPAGTSELAAAAALTGQVVERDRAALVRRIAPVGFLAAAGMAQACDEVGDDLARRAAELGWDEVVEEGWAAVQAAVEAAGPGSVERLTDRQVARLAWALRDVDLRDRALGLALSRSAAAAEAVWTELTRRAPAPLDAAPATLLAVTAWVRGDGALANVALERALGSEPSYSFAVLLRSALDACLRPAEIRRLIREAGAPRDARR
ncbi:DUF4192 domain-containing protein [Modestobacter versicolor]|uniref:DUF4192 domain-containing protein n=1 Tax=Modestobacter versicolor TaxID=429133 RepID=A0A323V9X1_9ACTN|nr:DUF4192 domain-containing protein [Modestobacter versicolor]MBB3674483.1 hypothetical protein [Modestobacter versicolor]PZA21549.1 DUF4192 domain-containing protein [Modestobacter versicolor]